MNYFSILRFQLGKLDGAGVIERVISSIPLFNNEVRQMAYSCTKTDLCFKYVSNLNFSYVSGENSKR